MVAKDLLEAVTIAVLLSTLLIIFVVQAFYIPSQSMLPTFKPGDRILVNKFIYDFRKPKRQEIIVFKYPNNPSRNFVKRVIGLPGDVINIKDGVVYRNGNPLEEDYKYEKSYGDFKIGEIPPGNYFVLGDNRNNSKDSRYWGFVPDENIVGKPFLVFWPLMRIKLIGGKSNDYSMVSRTYG